MLLLPHQRSASNRSIVDKSSATPRHLFDTSARAAHARGDDGGGASWRAAGHPDRRPSASAHYDPQRRSSGHPAAAAAPGRGDAAESTWGSRAQLPGQSLASLATSELRVVTVATVNSHAHPHAAAGGCTPRRGDVSPRGIPCTPQDTHMVSAMPSVVISRPGEEVDHDALHIIPGPQHSPGVTTNSKHSTRHPHSPPPTKGGQTPPDPFDLGSHHRHAHDRDGSPPASPYPRGDTTCTLPQPAAGSAAHDRLLGTSVASRSSDSDDGTEASGGGGKTSPPGLGTQSETLPTGCAPPPPSPKRASFPGLPSTYSVIDAPATHTHTTGGAAPSDAALPPGLEGLIPGIGLAVLRQAMDSVGAVADEQGIPSLGPAEFSTLYASVFPRRVLDAAELNKVAELYDDIDRSGDGSVDLVELLEYLHSAGQQSERRPETLREWMWVIVAPFGAAGTYDTRVHKEDHRMMWVQTVYKALSQIFILLYLTVVIVESNPRMQNSADGADPGTDLTFALETAAVAFFLVELLAYAWSHPRGLAVACSTAPSRGEAAVPHTPHSVVTDATAAVVAKASPHRPLVCDTILWIDVCSIAPYFIELACSRPWLKSLAALRFTRMLRLLKVLRTLRMVLHPSGFVARIPKLVTALKRCITALAWLAMLIFVLLAITSTWVWYAEQEDAAFDFDRQEWIRRADSPYPDAGQPTMFQDIPECLWWGVVTVTTVGYGDKYPVTWGGRLVGTMTIMAGLIVLAFPITILGAVFQNLHDEQQQEDEREQRCRAFYKNTLQWIMKGGNLCPKPASPSPCSGLGRSRGRGMAVPRRIGSERYGTMGQSPHPASPVGQYGAASAFQGRSPDAASPTRKGSYPPPAADQCMQLLQEMHSEMKSMRKHMRKLTKTVDELKADVVLERRRRNNAGLEWNTG